MKVVIGVVVVLVLAVAGAGVFLLQNLDGIVKDLIEDIGTEVVGQKVSVADVKVNLAEGSASISGLSVANPPGFSAEPASAMPESGEIPCSFPAEQGTDRRDGFAPVSYHRH